MKNIPKFIKDFLIIKEEVLELKFFGETPLHSVGKDVSVEEGCEIAQKLTEVLLKYRKITGLGRGIAAPQIGLQKNVFITYINDEVQTYINPVITKKSKETNFYRELCMSSSLIWSDVERPEKITIEWTDQNNKRNKEEFDGFMARLLQHENDHLMGCICLDKAIPGTIGFVNSDPLKEEIRNNKLI